MKYLLDTNVLVDYLRKNVRINEDVLESGAGISILTQGELYYGAFKSKAPEVNLVLIDDMISEYGFPVIDIDDKAVLEYARVKANLEEKGKRLEDLDLLIAASALSIKLTLVTRNVKHFERIKGLKLLRV
ncbi:hypothetical protein A2V80_00625 [Candidatus Woesebacteria bacterium RBG_16_39_8b]|uniref:Ribonuclease VapC n=1 Tax=Candidatus Woesebacteria bacterium RBG_16_39_8b TaxID=1802482 RepID=A0A1F7X8U6_9BACT|nr:MAG: hypothetical protein A2V80_00625 [Candidatus Woesebacteria bacterium RBG_16_39_8b]